MIGPTLEQGGFLDSIGRGSNPLDMEEMEKLFLQRHRTLTEFIEGCSADPDVRTAATTTLVLSLWQLAGPSLTHHLPSLILLNGAEAAPDPIDELAKLVVFDEDKLKARKQTEGPFAYARVDSAPTAMKNAIQDRQALGSPPPDNTFKPWQAKITEERYQGAQRAAFGYGPSRPYAQAWHEDFALLTDFDRHLILRLNEGPDRLEFAAHVLLEPGRLLVPLGIGRGLRVARKDIAVSGSLTPELCDEDLVRGIVDLGLPILFLPHTAEEPLLFTNQRVLEILAETITTASLRPVESSLSLPCEEMVAGYEEELWKRLGNLPRAYRFAVLQAVHQLQGVCEELALFTASHGKAEISEIEALARVFYIHTLRGIVIGIASLAWHGLGFDPGLPWKTAKKVLRLLRDKGPMTKSAQLQYAHIKKAERDLLLERLEAEGLIQVEDKLVTAASYPEFVRAIYQRILLSEGAHTQETAQETTSEAG